MFYIVVRFLLFSFFLLQFKILSHEIRSHKNSIKKIRLKLKKKMRLFFIIKSILFKKNTSYKYHLFISNTKEKK